MTSVAGQTLRGLWRSAPLLALSASFAGAAQISAVWAAEVVEGQPKEWQLGFQPPATPVMHQLENFHNGILFPLIVAISSFVLVLLLFIMVRFNVRANPVPSKNAHNTLIEVVWTVIPVMILVMIAWPSFELLFSETRIPPADVTIKVTGHAWNWEYEYPDQGGINFTALMTQDADLTPGQPRLLTADHKMVVPVNKNVHVLTTGADVIHSWAVPAFGVKIDAIPGRLNETWFKAEREGVFYGQCSELCGKDHAFMPIEIHVVSEDLFKRWSEAAQKDVDEAGKLLAEAEAMSSTKVAAAGAAGAQAQ